MFYFTESIGNDLTIPKMFIIFTNDKNLRICDEEKKRVL